MECTFSYNLTTIILDRIRNHINSHSLTKKMLDNLIPAIEELSISFQSSKIVLLLVYTNFYNKSSAREDAI